MRESRVGLPELSANIVECRDDADLGLMINCATQ